MLKVNNKWRRSGVFIVNFEYISRLVFLLLTLNMQLPAGIRKDFHTGIPVWVPRFRCPKRDICLSLQKLDFFTRKNLSKKP